MPHHPDHFATIPISHVVTARERAEALRQQPGAQTKRRLKPQECQLIGHAWAIDEGRDGWLICLACDVVRED